MGYFFSLFALSKSATETALKNSEATIVVSGLLLAFGAIGEYLEEHNRLPRWMRWPKIVFIVLVVASLIGEFFGDGGVFVFSEHLESINNAETSALRARVESEIDARLTLEKQVRSEGPRYILLREAASVLAKNLTPFAGQRADLLICGTRTTTDLETKTTWGILANILGSDRVEGVKGAGWELERPDPFWDKCFLSMQGIGVFVSSLSPRKTMDAAEALSKGLLDALPRYNKMPSIIDPAFMNAARQFMDKDDPQRLASDNPDRVVVFIGEHPPQ